MPWSTPRWRAVRAARRGTQAEALRDLAAAEEAVRAIEARVADLSTRIRRIERERLAPAGDGPVAAGLLATAALSQDVARQCHRELEQQRAALIERLAAGRARVETARLAAADATAALRRIEDLEPE